MHYTSVREQEEAGSVHPDISNIPSAIIAIPVATTDKSEEFLPKASDGNQLQRVLFLSRLDRKKGLELLLEAFSRLRGGPASALLVIAGSGEKSYVKELRGLAERLGIEKSVRWVGFLEGREKAAAFARATVFVLPSYSENFGIAAAEALAAGVPVLISDQVAIADDVRKSNAGLVVACDVTAIAGGLRKLLSDPSLCSIFASRGRSLAAQQYSSPAVGEQLMRLYDSVIESSRKS